MTTQTCRYAWCHAHQDVGDNGEPAHTSRTARVTVPEGSGDCVLPEQAALLRADLFYDEAFVETSTAVWIASERADELRLDRHQAEQLADDLEVFVRDLRALAAHLPAGEAK